MENNENTPQETKEVKKSNTLNYVALAIVIFFAGYYVLSANDTKAPSVDIADEGEQIDETPTPDGKGADAGLLSAGKYGEAGQKNLWKNTHQNFTLKALHEWEVHQIDAGPVSIVEVYHPDNASSSVTVWLQASSLDIQDINLTFDDWVVGSTQNMTDVKECEQREIGGLAMSCRTGYIGDEYWRMYFGELSEALFTGVFKPVEAGKETKLWEVVNEINFEPSESDLENAIIIP